MKSFLKVSLTLFLVAHQALAQLAVNVANNYDDLVSQRPITSRRGTDTLGGAVPNDGWGSSFVWDPNSNAATNVWDASFLGRRGPFAYPYGVTAGRWLENQNVPSVVQPREFVNPEFLGPAGDGVTDDTAVVQAAINLAATKWHRTVSFLSGKVYRIAVGSLTVPDNVRLHFQFAARWEPVAHPQNNGGANERQNFMCVVGDNVQITSDGGENFNGRRYDPVYQATIPGGTYRQISVFAQVDSTNTVIRNFTFANALDAPVYGRRGSWFFVEGCQFLSCSQAMRTEMVDDIRFRWNKVIGSDMTFVGVDPTVTVFQDGNRCYAEENYIDGIFGTAGSNGTVSCFNMFSSLGGRVYKNFFGPLVLGSTLTYTPITMDGSDGTYVGENIFYALNTGGAIINCEGARNWWVDKNIFVPPPPELYTGTEPGYLVYCRSAEIRSTSKPGGTQWLNAFIQERSRTMTYNGRVTDNYLVGGNIGMFCNASDVLVTGNWFLGQRDKGMIIESHVNGITTTDDFSIINTTHRHRNIRVMFNFFAYAYRTALTISDGDNVAVWFNDFVDNDQEDLGAHAIATATVRNGTCASGSTSTLINLSAAITASAYGGRHIYFPETSQIAEIESNTANDVTLRGAGVTTPPANGAVYYILRGHLKRMSVRMNRIWDDSASIARTNAASLNPTQTISAGVPFYVDTDNGELFQPNRHLNLIGVLTGNADITVRVLGADQKYVDRYWVIPVNPTSGTFATTTASGGIKAGTGTMSHTASGPAGQFETQTGFTGSGTAFPTWGQLKDNCWVGVSGQWLRVQKVVSATAGNFLTKPSANFAGQAFVISSFNITADQKQGRAYDFLGSPVKLALEGNEIYGNEGASGVANPQGRIDLASCPDCIPRILGNSTTPATDVGFPVMRFAYTANTTITSLGNATHGQRLTIVMDGFVELGFASGGTKLIGNGGVSVRPAAGTLTIWNYIQTAAADGVWHVIIVE